jgi:hypothetical protein
MAKTDRPEHEILAEQRKQREQKDVENLKNLIRQNRSNKKELRQVRERELMNELKQVYFNSTGHEFGVTNAIKLIEKKITQVPQHKDFFKLCLSKFLSAR